MAETRPSTDATTGWSWSNVHRYDWLRRHNLRAAGNGMPWPNVTVVPEGAVTRIAWRSGPGLAGQPVEFVTGGDRFLPSQVVSEELARFVDEVIDRLRDSGVGETPLSKEWREIRTIDAEEADFARAAARLGLDPYAMPQEQALELVDLAEGMEEPLFDEFLDSADPRQLTAAFRWLRRANARAETLSGKPVAKLTEIAAAGGENFDIDHPWNQGYVAARALRQSLGLASTARIDMDWFVPKSSLSGSSAGLQGYALKKAGVAGIALVLPGVGPSTATRFAQARALGLLLLGGNRQRFLLDPASSDLTKKSRAFAAELLAPSDGISKMMGTLPGETEAAFDAIARRFGASPLLVRRQYENQVLS